MTEKSNLPSALLEHIPWEAGSNPIWPATAFTVHRNLNRFNFPPKLSAPSSSKLSHKSPMPFSTLPLYKNRFF